MRSSSGSGTAIARSSTRRRRSSTPRSTSTARCSRPRRSNATRTSSRRYLPMDDPRIYPVSGGSEAVETAIKMARAYHLARGDDVRTTIIARRSSYHGNTLGALDASGKEPIRKPYTAWLGRFLHAPAAYEYRCGNPRAPRRLRRVARRRARTDDLARRRGDRGGVHRRAGGRRHARRRRSHRRLLAGDRRGLPAVRRPGDRGRGHDRVRQDRTLVRRRPLGRPPRHPHGRQGDHERLRAVRVRGGERRRLRHGRVRRVRPRVHVVAQRARRGRGERGPAPPVERRVDRAERRPGRAAPARTWASRSTAPRPSATCAGWA